ncbi:Protein McrC [bioreactor metagenome]|uniref:Protein McrC n=1 Tax=bioreactor metagenome TaxID=1076179 RepID=A0A645EFV9_9ZZZZ
MNICYLVIEGMLMSDTGEKDMKLREFIDDEKMSKLFEKFILEFYRKEFPNLKVDPSKIKWLVNKEDPWISLLPEMRSDITIDDGKKVLIIDAKYYSRTLQFNSRFGNETVYSVNIYQVFTYVKNRDVKHDGSISGMLLYPKTEDGKALDLSYVLDGNQLSIRTLDLNCNFSEIKQQLFDIIERWQGK